MASLLICVMVVALIVCDVSAPAVVPIPVGATHFLLFSVFKAFGSFMSNNHMGKQGVAGWELNL